MLLVNQLTEDIISGLFLEFEGDDEYTGPSYDDWKSENNINYETMTDQQIFYLLPEEIIPFLGDILMNESWYHGGR